MDRDIAAKYIRDNFEPSDRLAVVLLNKQTGRVTQRIASADRIASPAFQSWLRHMNAQKHEIYVSMNTLREGATGRTKADVQAVRHVYLDFDENGSEAVDRLLSRTDLPQPSSRVSTSPGKWQVAWKVEGFVAEQAETFQRWLARDTGADPAATDCARVMRLPGFYNHKYETPHFVSVEAVDESVHRPEDFPEPERQPEGIAAHASGARRGSAGGGLSQSERDWAFAKRALARGESQESVITAIALLREYEKHNPQYYAEVTVRKAAQALERETPLREANAPDR
jgi:hypothetical protein